MGRVARILSIDGCGFRGRVQLLVLDQLMKKIQASDPSTYPETPRPCEIFDLICGTATGGLIAILVGRLGMSCSDAIGAYERLEGELFSGIHSFVDLTATLATPDAFNTDSFKRRLQKIVQDNADTSVQPPTERVFMQANDRHTKRCRTFVTVVSANAVADKDAYRIRSYEDPKPAGLRDPEIVPGHRWQIWEAAIGAISCPRLFSPFELQTQSLFQAANASGFSNPSMIAYTEALDLFGNDAEVTLVSLGMGLRNRHDYSSPTATSIDAMITSLGSSLQSQIQEPRLREFVEQTQLVATGTRIKDLRVADRIRRAGPSQQYYRLDPPRNGNPIVMVDYAQGPLIGQITSDFFTSATHGRLWTDTVSNLLVVQSRPWHWQLIQDYTVEIRAPDTRVVVSVGQNQPTPPTPLQIMRKCYDWEAQNPTERISCFNTNGQLVVGPIVPQRNNKDIDLYVRVLLDDDWRFFSRRRPRSNGPLRLTEELDMDSNPRSPLEAVQAAMQTTNVRAFNFKGDCTSNAAGLSETNLRFDSGAVFPYEGVWIRNG